MHYSLEVVIAIGCNVSFVGDFVLLLPAEIKEVGSPVCLVVEILWIIKDEREAHILAKVDAV